MTQPQPPTTPDLFIFPTCRAIVPHPHLDKDEAAQAEKDWLSWPDETPSKARTVVIIGETELGPRITRMQIPAQRIQRLPRAI